MTSWRPHQTLSTNKTVGNFTLVELLVVIAIISILAALLLPTLQQAQLSSYNAGCINNIRQNAFGMNLYFSSTGEYSLSPMFTLPKETGTDYYTYYWYTHSVYYSDTIPVMTRNAWLDYNNLSKTSPVMTRCPGDPTKFTNSSGVRYYSHNYAYNGWSKATDPFQAGLDRRLLSTVRKGSQVMLLGDFLKNEFDDSAYRLSPTAVNHAKTGYSSVLDSIYAKYILHPGDQMNHAYIDLHVEAINPVQFAQEHSWANNTSSLTTNAKSAFFDRLQQN